MSDTPIYDSLVEEFKDQLMETPQGVVEPTPETAPAPTITIVPVTGDPVRMPMRPPLPPGRTR